MDNDKSSLDISSDGECGNVPVPRFTAELKAKWIEALRSGKYRQTQLALKDEDGFCCLGVLCDVAKFESSHDSFICADVDRSTLSMPPENARLINKETQEALWTMNDDDEKDFVAIADYIEAHIPAEDV